MSWRYCFSLSRLKRPKSSDLAATSASSICIFCACSDALSLTNGLFTPLSTTQTTRKKRRNFYLFPGLQILQLASVIVRLELELVQLLVELHLLAHPFLLPKRQRALALVVFAAFKQVLLIFQFFYFQILRKVS